jgi:hypothetical protein
VLSLNSHPSVLRRAALAAGALTLSLAIGACGSGSHSASPSAATQAASRSAAAPTTTGALSSGVAAVVGSTPITVATFNHWMQVFAAAHATKTNPTPIVPDPPAFTRCIAAARASGKVSNDSLQRLKADCQELFRVDADQVMDFLIKSDWLVDAGTAAHDVPSQSEVQANLAAEKSKQFKSGAAFAAFLAQTKQTQADVLLRIKTGRIEALLAKRAGGAKQLLDQLSSKYAPQTHCGTLYVNPDCAESSKGSSS